MKHYFRKRFGALLLAAVVGVTSLGGVTTAVSGASSASEHFIDFSFPFDFLFFHFGEEKQNLTEEELEMERDRLRELSMQAEKAAGLKFVYEYTMDTPQAVATLDLSGCSGAGGFAFADPQFVPEKGVSVCEVVFTPNDISAYDYDQMLGWDSSTQTLRRYVEVICSSLVALEEEVKIEAEIVSRPEIFPKDEDIPEATPEVTVPEITPEVTPEVTVPETTPEVTPEDTVPEAIPEVTPEDTVPETAPEVTPDIHGPESSVVSRPIMNLIPEINSIPELVTPEATPEATPTPEPYVTAPIMQGILAETGVPVITKDDVVKTFEASVQALTDSMMSQETLSQLLVLTKEYEAMSHSQKDTVASDILAKLDMLQEQAATYNHTSNGVTVSGNLPWYVQLIVTIGNDTDTYVPTGLETIVPYEMCLWNLLTDSEYVLGGGEKVTLSMAVPENIHLYDGLTIVHYMDETHYEYIELKISGDTLSFETASFSPFNIAGSTVLVGGKTENNTQSSIGSGSNKKEETKPTVKPSGNSGNKQENKDQNKNTGKDNNKKQESTSTGTSVKTGDSSAISQFIMIALGAVVLILLCVLIMKRSRIEDECEEDV